MKESIAQLDVTEEQLALKNKISGVNISTNVSQKTEREKALEKYASFFKKNLSRLDDIEDSNYLALEIVNDEGLTISSQLQENGGFTNFKICHASLVETLLENPAKLSQISLIHAVMPFDDIYPLIQSFNKIPEVTNSKTRVVLGTYDNYDEEEHQQNIRVLNGLIRGLDFYRYKGLDIDGTSVKMVYSTYQQNLRMRH